LLGNGGRVIHRRSFGFHNRALTSRPGERFPVRRPARASGAPAGAGWARFWRVSEIVFRVDGRSQPVPADDARDIRGPLVERPPAADELRSAINAAIRRAESGGRPALDVTEERRGEQFRVLVAIKADRGLTPALSELETTLLR
jgi:hypothetical protein